MEVQKEKNEVYKEKASCFSTKFTKCTLYMLKKKTIWNEWRPTQKKKGAKSWNLDLIVWLVSQWHTNDLIERVEKKKEKP